MRAMPVALCAPVRAARRSDMLVTFSRAVPCSVHTSPACTQVHCLSSTATQNARPRLSSLFMPTLKAAQQAVPRSAHDTSTAADAAEHSLNLLLRGGYIRQSSSGVYTLLPLGLRVVQKLQAIIDDEMEKIGASRIEMPMLLSSALWRKTGRWATMGSELYRLQDRRGSEYVLGPTHEEEVTRLVADEVHSGRALPVRVYQITTKHRDEPRPRSGLLRTRAFLMKDLYTFDSSLDSASATYEQVRGAYARIFDRILGRWSKSGSIRATSLWNGWKAAEADTGAIGGRRSHEYHFEDAAGEDHLLSCSNTASCDYAANVERAVSVPARTKPLPHTDDDITVHLFGPSPATGGKGATHVIAGARLHAVVVRKSDALNDVKIARLLSPEDPKAPVPVHLWSEASAASAGAAEHQGWDWVERPEGPMVRFSSLEITVDSACSSLGPEDIEHAVQRSVRSYASSRNTADQIGSLPADQEHPRLADFFPSQLRADADLPSTAQLPIRHEDVRTAEEGDTCASCRQGTLTQHRAVEVGHTFLLGTRYSDALEVGFVPVAGSGNADGIPTGGRLPFQMGCYGIGVTRLVGVLAQRAVTAFNSVQQPREGQKNTAAAGLLWPPSVAPFRAVIVAASLMTAEKEQAIERLGDQLVSGTLHKDEEALQDSDILVDDRHGPSLGAKLKDADLIGAWRVYIFGKHWEKTGEVEVRCAGEVSSFVKI